MTWNYRVMKKNIAGEDCYAIHEVHYDVKGNKEHTVEDVSAGNMESVAELRTVLQMMLEACDEPALSSKDFE